MWFRTSYELVARAATAYDVRLRSGSGHPRDQPAARRFLGGDPVEPVVAPLAVDVQVARRVADLADAELLDDAQRVGVLRPDRDLDAVQAGREAVVDDEGDGARHDPAAGVRD